MRTVLPHLLAGCFLFFASRLPSGAQLIVTNLWVTQGAQLDDRVSIAGGVVSEVGSLAQGTNSTATAPHSIALGSAAAAQHSNTFIWSDGTAIGTGTNRQFVVFAENGIYLLGGPVFGNAAGLTNVSVNVDAIVGLGSAARSEATAFATATQGNKADTALQGDGTVSWTAPQDAGGQTIQNLTGAFAVRTNQVYCDAVITNLVGLIIGITGTSTNWGTGTYVGSPEYGFNSDESGWVTWNATSGWSWISYSPIGYFSGANMSFGGTIGESGVLDVTFDMGYLGLQTFSLLTQGISNENDEVIGFSATVAEATDLSLAPLIEGNFYYVGNYTWINGLAGFVLDGSSMQAWVPDYGARTWGHFSVPGTFVDTNSATEYAVDGIFDFATNQIGIAECYSTPFEIADGRHAWVGTHDGGGFSLTNLSEVCAQVLVGDGSRLFNIGGQSLSNAAVGVAQLDLESVDARYVLKTGDVILGDLAVQGTLYSNGRAVGSTERVPMRGDILMGGYTNSPAEP